METAQRPAPNDRPVSTLLSLWALVRSAGAQPVSGLRVAVGLTALASLGDIASLALLQHSVIKLAEYSGSVGTEKTALAAFLSAVLIATILRFVAQHKTVAAQYEVTRALALRAFRSLLMQDYVDYLKQGPSAGFAAFERLNLIAQQALSPFIGVVVALVNVVALIVAVTWLYPAAGALLGLALALIVIEAGWRKPRPATDQVSQLVRTRAALLYEARSAFRHIFLTNSQDQLYADFAAAETSFRRQQAHNIAAAQTSRHKLEITGLILALTLLFGLGPTLGDGATLLPLLAVFALTALRLLPQAAMLRTSLRLVALHGEVTAEVRALIDQTPEQPRLPGTEEVRLTRTLRLEDVAVSRRDQLYTLAGLNLIVPRGVRIGIRGASGVGKSTLLDVICGAIPPDRGQVLVDDMALDAARGTNWRTRIGMVSQSPVLLGRTIREAVTFPERPQAADPARFQQAIERAGISAMTADFAQGLDTPVGEAIAHLSGGQRQRLALAHALYRARDLLILDEATGQLDTASEDTIVEVLKLLPRDLTVIVASHRAALFECCDTIYELADGRLSPA